MTLTELKNDIRNRTAHDGDQQVVDVDHLEPWIHLEYRKLYRKLVRRFPERYIVTSSSTTLSGSTQTIARPAAVGRLLRVERSDLGTWIGVPRSSSFLPELDQYLGFREEGANYVISPLVEAPGTYRLVYVPKPSAAYVEADIPDGFEEVIIERVVAHVVSRTSEDDAQVHRDLAQECWDEACAALAPTTEGPEPGFVSLQGD